MKNRRNHIINCILSIILILTLVLGGIPASISADEVYTGVSATESAPNELQNEQENEEEKTEGADTEENSGNSGPEETENTNDSEESGQGTGDDTQDSGNSTQDPGNGTQDSGNTSEGTGSQAVSNAPSGTAGEKGQESENESTESAEYKDRQIEITFNNKDHNGVETYNVFANDAVVYVRDTLTAVLSTTENADPSDADASAYTYEWQIQDVNNADVFYAVENGNGMEYTPTKAGTYRLHVYRSSDEANHFNEYDGYFGLIVVSLIPVQITWEPAEKIYDGKTTLYYSGSSTVTRTDDGSEITSCEQTVSGQIINTENANVGEYTEVSMNNVGTPLSETDYFVSSNVVKVTIKPAVLDAKIKVAGKNYDGTDAVEKKPAVTWDVHETGLNANDLSLIINDHKLQASDLKYSNSGDVSKNTKVSVAFREDVPVFAAIKGEKNDNYLVNISFVNKPTIKMNSFTSPDCVEYPGTENDSDTIWVNGTSTSAKAKTGYTIAADLGGDYAENADVNVTNKGAEFYAKKANGDIGFVVDQRVKKDTDAPVVVLQKTSFKIFDWNDRNNTYDITENGSGIAVIRYIVTDKELEDAKVDESWKEVTVDDNNQCSIELTVPKKGYVYFYTKDKAGNESYACKHILVLEKDRPTVVVNNDQSELNNAAVNHDIKITASDAPDNGYSGIQRIEYKLTGKGADNKVTDVTDDVTFVLKEISESTEVPLKTGNKCITTDEPSSIGEINKLKKVEFTLGITGADSFDGNYKLTLTAYDYCGNESKSVEVDLTFDNKEPEILVTPENGNGTKGSKWYFNADKGQQIKISFSDSNLKEEECNVTLKGPDGEKVACLNNQDVDTSIFSVDSSNHTVTISEETLKGLSEGEYTLSFKAADTAGNVSSSAALSKTDTGSDEESGSESEEDKDDTEFSFVIDRTSPSVTEIAIETDGVIKAQTYGKKKYLKFSEPFSVNVTIKEENLQEQNSDVNLIKPAAGTAEEGDDAAGSSAATVTGPEKSIEPNTWKVTFSMNESGEMLPSVTGTDLAGNTVKLADDLKYTVPISSKYMDDVEGTEDGSARTIKSWWEESEDKVFSARTLVYSDTLPSITLTYQKKTDKKLELIGKENTLEEKTAYYNNDIQVEAAVENFDDRDYELITVVFHRNGEIVEEKTLKDILGKNASADGKVPMFTKEFFEEANYSISFIAANNYEKTLHVVEKSPYENGTDQESFVKAEDELSQGGTPTNWTLVIDRTSPELSGKIIPDDGVNNKELITTKIDDRYYFNNDFTYSFSIHEHNLVLGEDSLTIHIGMVTKTAPSGTVENSGNTEDGKPEEPIKKYYTEIVFDNSDYNSDTELEIFKDGDKKDTFGCFKNVSSEGVYAVYAYGTDLAGNPIIIVNGEDFDAEKDRQAFVSSFEDGAITKHITYTTVVDRLDPVVDKDSLRPTIEVSTIPTDIYCNNGAPLINVEDGKNIPFAVKVEDPIETPENEDSKNEVRAGLASISYVLYSFKEEKLEDGSVVESSRTLIGETKNSIWEYNVKEETDNNPIYLYQGNFYLPVTSEINRNNLVLVVSARDRAGNENTIEYYFGVDNAPPVVKVEFDNNDVANGKYFKGLRTATITVYERNFVDDLMDVSVEVTPDDTQDNETLFSDSGWSGRTVSGTDNGDGDTFTRTISFMADGDYVFHVSGTDAAGIPAEVSYVDKEGNPASAPNEFTIDTVSPKIEVRYKDTDVHNGKYFHEDRSAVITVNERNFSVTEGGVSKNFINITTEILTEGLEYPGKISIDEDWSGKENIHTKNITFNGDGDFTFRINEDSVDAAGNPAVITYVDEAGKKAAAPNEFTIDKHGPAVNVTMEDGNQYDEGFYYRSDNCGIKVSIDDHGHSVLLKGDGKSEYPVYEVKVDGKEFGKLGKTPQGSDIVSISEDRPSILEFVFSPDGMLEDLTDGTHTISINVTDIAGNSAMITFSGCKQSEDEREADFILDETAPVYSVKISPSENVKNKDLNVSQGNRYYFNAEYTMTAHVSDTNLDVNRITVLRDAKNGTDDEGKPDLYDSSSVVISSFKNKNTTVKLTGKVIKGDSTQGEYTDAENHQNGVYRYAIYGSDKAGNALELKKGETDNIDGNSSDVVDVSEQEKTGSKETLAELTNHIVVDTITPVGTYEVSNGSETYYTMVQGQVTYAKPYRDETSAQLRVTVDNNIERTPVKIEYTIDAVPQRYRGSFGSGGYEYGAVVTSAQNGKQKFRLSSLTITDLAGNYSSTNSPNYIHLDYDIPVVDSIAPTINIVTTATTDCRDGNGQPLFNSDVPLLITVTDPDGGQSSSGLADVTYEMYVNESLVSSDTRILRQAVEKEHKQNYTDPDLYFSQQWPVNVDSASHNYNNLRVLVTATDNAGFKSTAEYRFGIDVTPPTISVTYDNNDALNEKYFKADRTATVVVTERNFDAGRISIDTQTAAISGWSHASGGSANGDDDTWTATVSYTTDGNYTLAVSGSDRLGWTAGETTYNGVAPTDFVLDKTAPVISITYDNNDVRNEKYYKADRTATITVTDVNFNGTNAVTVNASGGGQAPGVGFSGNSASLPFTTDGIYSFSGTVTDMAGNVSAVFSEPEFVLDKTKPQISISGVENLSANRVPLNIILTMLDTNLNEGSIIATLSGTNNGAVDISGKKAFISGGVQYTLDTIQVDDYYQLVFTGIDLAGNEETITISFSENQNGTTFEFVQKEVAGKYTNKTFKPQFILHNVDVVTILSVTVNGKEVDYEYRNNTLTLKDEITNDGKYVIAITTKDAAGNINSMDPIEFYLDQRSPVISQKGLENTNNGNYKKVYSTPFDLTILHDIPDDAFVVVKLNGKELKPSEYTINADGSITLAIDKYQKYDIEVIVTDAAGNESSARWQFELTRNPFKLWFSNKPLFYGSLVGLLLLLFLIILLLKRRKDDEEKEANE